MKEHTTDHSAVIIDGAVPRDPWERVDTIYLHAVAMLNDSAAARHEVIDQAIALGRICGESKIQAEVSDPGEDSDETARQTEDEIVDFIAGLLPVGWTCSIGLHQPGDVIIHETEED